MPRNLLLTELITALVFGDEKRANSRLRTSPTIMIFSEVPSLRSVRAASPIAVVAIPAVAMI